MKRKAFLLSLILLTTALCFYRVLENGFVWDDHIIVADNPGYRGFSLSHLQWMFTTLQDAQYHPLVWMSFGLDYQLWNMSPRGFHLTNLFLHMINVAVLFFFMKALFNTQALKGRMKHHPGTDYFIAGGTLFFALHPLHVESVVYVSAQGNLMSAGFLMLSVTAYLGYARQVGKSKTLYYSALAAFGLSLLCKAWGITLPFILLILDLYPLRRASVHPLFKKANAKLLVEKWPFLVFSLAAALPAFIAKARNGLMQDLGQHDFLGRVMQSAYGMVFYQ